MSLNSDGEIIRLRNRTRALEANGAELLARAEFAEAQLSALRAHETRWETEHRKRTEAEAAVERVQRAVVDTYGEDYSGEDVAAEVERLMRHLSEFEVNVGQVIAAKNEGWQRAEAERDALKAAIEQGRALHFPDGQNIRFSAEAGIPPTCPTCRCDYPCPTVRALDGAHSPADAPTPVSAATEAHGGAGEAQEGSRWLDDLARASLKAARDKFPEMGGSE